MKCNAPLAHAWLEQRTHNPLVPCSTHGGGTICARVHTRAGTTECSLCPIGLFINFFAITDSQDKNTNRIIFDARDDTKVSNPVFPELAQFGSCESLAEFPWVALGC